MKLLTLCVTLVCVYVADTARILGVFYLPSYSHFTLTSTLMKELAARGHEVTVISPYPLKTPLKNYRDVELTGFVEEYKDDQPNFFELNSANFLAGEVFLNVLVTEVVEKVLQRKTVHDLLKSNEKFDLVILEDFVSHALKGFCYHYNAPCVMFSTIGLSHLIDSEVGNPIGLSYIPDFNLPYGSNMSLFERLLNSVAYVFSKLFTHLYALPRHNKLLQEHFPGAPDINELYYNVSLILLNSHVSTHQVVPQVPNLVDIGGFHLKPLKPLPKDLQEFVDNAKEGVIYFSMGSNLQSVNMPVKKREAILGAFSKLKQKVLWKWEDENLPGKPDNVKIEKWLPQPDVLAHPNVKLFVTHGGLLSTMEAVSSGVPLVGIPIYGDQKMNLANAINSGFALGVPYAELTEEKLLSSIQEVMTNPIYSENAKRRQKIMHDQPMKPLDKAVFWVEYVIRHRGAPHLRSAALNLSWYQYLLLDVVAFVSAIIMIIVVSFYFAIKRFLCKKCSKGVTRTKKNN